MQAGLPANTPQPAAQSPTATTHFGSGVARQVRSRRLAHVARHRSGDHQHIGMARRGDEAQAEAFQVVERVVECVDLQFAAVAGAGVDLADRQAAAEPALRRAVEVCRQRGEWRRFGDRERKRLQRRSR